VNEQTDTPYEFRQQVQEQIGSVEVYDLSHIIMPWSLTKRGGHKAAVMAAQNHLVFEGTVTI
jgi:hypothetical protein